MKNISLFVLSFFFIVCCFSKPVEAIERELLNVNDTIIKTNVDTSKIYTTVEVMPSFPGGEAEMQRFIAENLRYPHIFEENGIVSKAIVRFIVTKKGNIINIEAKTSSILCDSLISVVEKMPRWIPGKQNGDFVDVYFTLPILIHPKQ